MPRRTTRKRRRAQKGGALCEEGKKYVPEENSSNIESIFEDTDTYTLGEEFASSSWYVYKAKNHEGNELPELLIKVIGPQMYMGREELKREIEMTKKASDLEIGPRLQYSRICKHDTVKYYKDKSPAPVGFLVFEIIEGAREINKSDPEEMKEATDLLKKWNDKGFHHGDTHWGNVLWGTTASSPDKPRAWLIDFGDARPKKEGEKDEKFHD